MYNKIKEGGIVMKRSVCLVLAVVILGCGLVTFFLVKGNVSKVVKGSVSSVGAGYVIVVDEDNVAYSVSTDGVYLVGDQVSFSIQNPKPTNPVTGKVRSFRKLNQEVAFVIEDKKSDDELSKNDEVLEIPSESLKQEDKDSTGEIDLQNDSSSGVVSYLEEQIQAVDGASSFTTTVKAGFVQVVDFLFYGGTISGHTFSELSDEGKMQVLKLAFILDSKISKKFPHYKEAIQDTSARVYSAVKERVVSLYLELTVRVCQNNASVCASAKEGLSELKNNFSLTWEFIKNVSGTGFSKLKNWYEIWREV